MPIKFSAGEASNVNKLTSDILDAVQCQANVVSTLSSFEVSEGGRNPAASSVPDKVPSNKFFLLLNAVIAALFMPSHLESNFYASSNPLIMSEVNFERRTVQSIGHMKSRTRTDIVAENPSMCDLRESVRLQKGHVRRDGLSWESRKTRLIPNLCHSLIDGKDTGSTFSFPAYKMNRRRSARLRSSLDNSFQIPLAVNSTVNNLLLDDDALEHDFFDGMDYTLSTPVPVKAPFSDYSPKKLKPYQEVSGATRSEQENFEHSYDYAEEEREVDMGNTPTNEETPRRKHTHDPADRETTPTHRTHGSKRSHTRTVIALSSPAPVIASPVASEDFLTSPNESNSRTAAVYSLRRRTRSPSATPKPRRGRHTASSAQPSLHSTPVGATPSSSTSRSDRPQLLAECREPEAHMLHHKHAPSARQRSDSPLQSESDMGIVLTQTTLASKLSDDPRLPEKRLSVSPGPSRVRRLNSSQRRHSRSRTRSTSPLPFSRVGHDAVMLPIQEEDEDLQARDEQLPISKSQQGSGPSAPAGKEMMMTKERRVQRSKYRNTRAENDQVVDTNASSSSGAGAGRSKREVPLSPKSAAKRSGDNLASQPAPKKRKTGKIAQCPSSIPPKEGRLRVSPGQRSPVDETTTHYSTAELPMDSIQVITDAETNMPYKLPVASELNLRPPSVPLSACPSPELHSEPATGDTSKNLVHHELNETNEVQDFLSRYAKKYGTLTEASANNVPVNPRLPLPLASAEGNIQPDVPLISKRVWKENASAVTVPKGECSRTKVTQAPANPELKGKLKSKASNVTKGTRNVISGTAKVSSSCSASGAKPVDSGASKKTPIQDTIVLSDTRGVSEVPNPPMLEMPVSHGVEASPLPEQAINRGTSRGSFKVRSEVAAQCLTSAGRNAGVGETADSQISEVSVPVIARSVATDPLTATPDSRTLEGGVKPTSVVEKRRTEPPSTHGQGPVVVAPPKKVPIRNGTTQMHKRMGSSEPRTDDMFARKKLDNYLQKGIDLTAHSSRRFVDMPAPKPSISTNQRESYSQMSRQVGWNRAPSSSAIGTTLSVGEFVDPTVSNYLRPRTRAKNLPSETGDQKHTQSMPTDLECRDPPNGKKRRASQRDASETHGEDAAEPNFQIHGDVGQETNCTLSDSSRGCTENPQMQVAEDTRNRSTNSTGVILAERLVHISQRIMGSFGYFQ
ncbi:uncharacterized protein FOMMEDRAFT_161461 [Fomitiporia mediterranea MF3/22]|uniref:uncharacterized protein n=1 Tax=Fomitiporia mediterranea (strain MF3/22) TaxID=694068 RepID=UPI000440958F|nr:uncharacterized protein FOMMEDRAFT_161461 [Fomitiporia mediterranea MF3/22]EJC98634.1 hypothetical protein FOMMEDRAFT_161461 [Fomitiporia mediterranea MF3/22]